MDNLDDFYTIDKESNRLSKNEGIIEFERSKEIIERYFSCQNMKIGDVGGGDGKYSRWLASLGYYVSLFDISESLINRARLIDKINPQLKNISVSDARNLPIENNYFDMILMMGPLYHLQSIEDRLLALQEAFRVLKNDGVILVSAISRYGSLSKAIKHHLVKYSNLAEEDFQSMIINEVKYGIHERPQKYPQLLPSAYCHGADELKEEMKSSGFSEIELISIEGPFWTNNLIIDDWNNQKEFILPLLKNLEKDHGIINLSLHFFGVGKK